MHYSLCEKSNYPKDLLLDRNYKNVYTIMISKFERVRDERFT
jgi:hypothetical protein